MQMLHPFAGSVQQYGHQLANLDSTRPSQCPQCQTKQPLTAHGFYNRTLTDVGSNFDGSIRVRRYLCESCQRTVSLLPEFALPYLRFSIAMIAAFLIARLVHKRTLQQALPEKAPYQRGQHWLRRFGSRAERLCASLSALTAPVKADSFALRALGMLNSVERGFIGAHRFLFAQLRDHMLGWPPSLAPDGRRTALNSAVNSG